MIDPLLTELSLYCEDENIEEIVCWLEQFLEDNCLENVSFSSLLTNVALHILNREK